MYLHPSAGRIRVSLEGHLAGVWVYELELVWHTLSPEGDSEPLIVDVTRLESADARGMDLLKRMESGGVTIVGAYAERPPTLRRAIHNFLTRHYRARHSVTS